MDINSVRDVVKDSIRETLAEYHKIQDTEVDSDLVGCLADAVFDALGLDEEDQDQIRETGAFVWLHL